MDQTRYSLIRVALLTVAVSAMVGGCAAETEPAPGPQVEPLNPQPLPPVIQEPDNSKTGDPAPAGETASSSGGGTSSGSSGTNPNASSSSSSSSSGSTDAGGQ